MVQARTAVDRSDRSPVPNAEMIGSAHPDERLEVTVRVRSRAQTQLVEHIQSLTSAQTPPAAAMSREEFAARFGADPADIRQVEEFAQRAGLTVVESSEARRSWDPCTGAGRPAGDALAQALGAPRPRSAAEPTLSPASPSGPGQPRRGAHRPSPVVGPGAVIGAAARPD